jgi:hypothetical protein
MHKKKSILYIEIAAFILLAAVSVTGFVMAARGQVAFMYFLREDGWIENLTVVFLLASSGIAIYRALGYMKRKAPMAVFFWAMTAFLFFFAAGEEISWGQRIFGLETPDFFIDKNLQNETNLHNLEIKGFKVNKWIFSRLLFAVMGFYLLLLRPLVARFSFFRGLVAKFQVPLARWFYVFVLLGAAVVFSPINLLKKSELIEFAFSLIFLLIFINPVLIRRDDRKMEQNNNRRE